MSAALGMAGGILDSLFAWGMEKEKSDAGQNPRCQDSLGARETPSHEDTRKMGSSSAGADNKSCPAQKQGCCNEKIKGCCTEKKESCPQQKKESCPTKTEPNTASFSPGDAKKVGQVWMQPIGLQGFAPSEVKVRLGDGMVHIHAKTEKASGPGSSLSKYEVKRIIMLPADVDRQTVSSIMTPNGTILIYASRVSQPVERKAGKPESVEKEEEDKEEKEAATASSSKDAQEKPEVAEQEAGAADGNVFIHLPDETCSQPCAEHLTEADDDWDESKASEDSTQKEIPIVDEPDTEGESEEYPSENEGKTCTMQILEEMHDHLDDEDFEQVSPEFATSTTSLDGEDECDESHENQKATADASEEVMNRKAENNTSDASENKPADEESVQKQTVTDPTWPIKRNEVTEEPSFVKEAEPFCSLIPLKDFHPEDLHIHLKENSLIVNAKQEVTHAGVTYTNLTQRRLELPQHVDAASVRCVFREDGMLVITGLPKFSNRLVPVERQ